MHFFVDRHQQKKPITVMAMGVKMAGATRLERAASGVTGA
jgi:hypothetical protein